MKKLLIDCDQVFDVLTRGPFPSGSADDESVEHHLRACHECRQLAEALRPAVALLHEAVAADEAGDLPGYQGSLPAIALSHDGYELRPVPARAEIGRCQMQSLAAVRFSAASILVAALSLLVYGLAMSPASNSRFQVNEMAVAASPNSSHGPDGIPDEQGLVHLVSLKLPAECFAIVHRDVAHADAAQLASALAAGSLDALRCCTECHRAGLEAARGPQFVALVRESCQACHRG